MPPPSETTRGLPAGLPSPSLAERAQANRVAAAVREAIGQAEGALPFDRYMELVLYGPGLGYYVAGARKFGAGGDFVTAPELSPLFSRCLARQCAEVLEQLGGGDILEFGAGAGTMAVDLLRELQACARLPAAYRILELSPELKARQRATLSARVPELLPLVQWCERLPDPGFRGIVLGNELLDAMPVHRFRIGEAGIEEWFVVAAGEGFAAEWRAAISPGLAEAVARIQQAVGPLATGYRSEVNLRLAPWLQSLAERLAAGVVLLIDYGYARREYYHAERTTGTLVCHFRHRVHDDPLVLPGLQDITANVDFTAVAEAGTRAGLDLEGYATQAHFLFGCGLEALLCESDPADVAGHLALVQGVKKLTLPGEMGERFKVIGLGRELAEQLRGFGVRDLSDRL